MTGNPLSGHTAANQASMTGSGVFTDSLEDGEHITSPSLTNMLEGVHGNGIILEEDTASSDSDRNTPEDLPGVCEQVTNSYTVRIEGGHAVIDGVVYAFAGGPGSTQDVTFTTTSAHRRATYSALTTGQEVLIVVYISTDTTNQCITWEMGTPVTTASNTYPTTPSAFLSEPKSGLTVKQSVVLAVIRAVYSGTGGDLYLNITESNDKRIFVRPNPIYFTPVTTGIVGNNTAVDSHTALDTLHAETGNLAASRLGAMWQSYNADGDANLYYSSKDSGGTRHTHLLGPTHVDVSSPSSNQTFTFGSNQIFVLTPSTTINLNPSGTFPPGYTVFVSVPSGSTVTFDSTGLNSNVVATEATMFTYDGSAWKKVMVSGTVSPASSGVSGLVQLSDGAGGFTSDADLSWDAAGGELTVNGKLTVTGLIDPTGLELTPQTSNPAAADAGVVDANTLWLDSLASNRPKIGSNAVMRENDNISELTNDAGFTDAAAAASAAPVQSVNTATGAVVLDADDLADGSTNVMMTTSERSKLTGIATGATAYADADAVAAVETEAGLDFSTSSNDAIVENTAQDKDIIFKINDGGTSTEVLRIDGSTGNVGIRLNQNVTADERLDVEDGNISLTTTSRTTERVLKLRNSGSTTSLSEIAMAGANSNNFEGYIAFKTKGPSDLYNDPLNEVMRIDGNKKVGIGTTSPDAKLHIEGDANDEVVLHITTEGGTGGAVQGKAHIGMSHFSTDTVPSATITVEEISVSDHRANMTFSTRASASTNATPTEKMRITHDGKVGIGETAPSADLHIKSSANFDPTSAINTATLILEQTGGTQADDNESVGMTFTKINSGRPFGSIAGVQTGSDADVGGLAFFTHDALTSTDTISEKMRIDGNGNVGIGTTSPDTKLHISGSAKVTSDLEIDGALNHDGSTVGFFGTAPASQTAVGTLGPQVVTPSPGEPTAADVTATQNAITALQAKLDDLINSLSNLGLV